MKITVSKDSGYTGVLKCIFEGIYLEEGFLIAGNTFEKIKKSKVEVTSCNFKNCYTKRSSKKILKEYDFYYGLFDRIVETNPLTFNNCVGLDQVVVYDSENQLPQFSNDNSSKRGVKAGLAAAGVAAVVGSPISLALGLGYGISRLLKDDELTEE